MPGGRRRTFCQRKDSETDFVLPQNSWKWARPRVAQTSKNGGPLRLYCRQIVPAPGTSTVV
eukprot:8074072-Lingulodinium_polyedra.AAC.1